MNVLGFKRKVIVDNTSASDKPKRKKYQRVPVTKTSAATAFGDKLRELREREGYSQARVARALGCNAGTYQHYEGGAGKFPAVYVKPLCALYGISVAELFDYQIPGGEKPAETESKADKVNALEKLVMGILDEIRTLK